MTSIDACSSGYLDSFGESMSRGYAMFKPRQAFRDGGAAECLNGLQEDLASWRGAERSELSGWGYAVSGRGSTKDIEAEERWLA